MLRLSQFPHISTWQRPPGSLSTHYLKDENLRMGPPIIQRFPFVGKFCHLFLAPKQLTVACSGWPQAPWYPYVNHTSAIKRLRKERGRSAQGRWDRQVLVHTEWSGESHPGRLHVMCRKALLVLGCPLGSQGLDRIKIPRSVLEWKQWKIHCPLLSCGGSLRSPSCGGVIQEKASLLLIIHGGKKRSHTCDPRSIYAPRIFWWP